MIVALSKTLVLAATLVLPVMLAARFVKAARKGFWPSLLSVSLQIAFLNLLGLVIHNQNDLVMLLAIAGGSLINSLVLKTTLVKGFVVGAIAILGAVILQSTILAGSYAAITSAT